ncbi:MAG: RsmE family RNA methyltransferase [Acidimicrobiales bacterium]
MTRLEWPRRVAALGQFRVADPGEPVLTKDDEHHLRHVLRARNGEEVVVTDGDGSWSICLVKETTLERVTDVVLDEPTPVTTIYLAPLKGDRSEWAVAKVTELGVSRIVPLVSERVIVRFKGEVRDKTVTRWRRIALESSGQCRRTYDMVVDDPLNVAHVPADVCLADFDGDGDWTDVTSVAIGPEGGWDPAEWDGPRRRLSLGPTVLRGETAAVVAASLLAFGQGGWGFALNGPVTR